MEPTAKYKLRENFHQAKWDEPIIFELHTPGERGILVPEAEPEVAEAVGDGLSSLPDNMIRKPPPALPEISQMRVLKHYLRLSQQCLGADLNIDIGQGTCTVKYNPKINKMLVGISQGHRAAPLAGSKHDTRGAGDHVLSRYLSAGNIRHESLQPASEFRLGGDSYNGIHRRSLSPRAR